MKVRRAETKDIQKLATLVNSAYRGESGMRGWTTEAHLLGGVRIDVERLEKMVSSTNEVVLVVDDEADLDRLLACVHLSRRPGDVVFLGMLTVDVDHQAGGLGKKLLSYAELFSKSEMRAKRVEMYVIAVREELIAWYERRDYRPTGLKHEFPKDVKFGIPLRDDLDFVSLYKNL